MRSSSAEGRTAKPPRFASRTGGSSGFGGGAEEGGRSMPSFCAAARTRSTRALPFVGYAVVRVSLEVTEGVGERGRRLSLSESVNEFGVGPHDAVAVNDSSDILVDLELERTTLHRELDGTHLYLRPRTTNVALGRRTSSTLLEAGPSVETVHGPLSGRIAKDAASVE